MVTLWSAAHLQKQKYGDTLQAITEILKILIGVSENCGTQYIQ